MPYMIKCLWFYNQARGRDFFELHFLIYLKNVKTTLKMTARYTHTYVSIVPKNKILLPFFN